MKKKRPDLKKDNFIAELIYVIAALCLLGLAYTLFDKTELKPVPIKLLPPSEVDDRYFENRD